MQTASLRKSSSSDLVQMATGRREEGGGGGRGGRTLCLLLLITIIIFSFIKHDQVSTRGCTQRLTYINPFNPLRSFYFPILRMAKGATED